MRIMINDEIIAMIVKTIIKTIRLKLIGLKIMRLKHNEILF